MINANVAMSGGWI